MMLFDGPGSLGSAEAAPYADIDDQIMHLRCMADIATQLHRPVQEILPVYEDILLRLKSHARIQDYLPIFVSKKVKFLFHQFNASRKLH